MKEREKLQLQWDKTDCRPFQLGENKAHIFYCDLSSISDSRCLKPLLSSREIHKANSFKTEFLRKNYIISHGILRLLLAKYKNDNPENIHYVLGQNKT